MDTLDYLSTADRFNINSQYLVSVVIPVTGNPIFLGEAITSILKQTFHNIEIIIVLNHAEEWVIESIESRMRHEPKLRYLVSSEKGISNAINLGIESAQGGLICRMDADDLMKSHRIESQVKHLNNNPHIGLVGSQITKIDVDGNPIGRSRYPSSVEQIANILKIRNCIAHPSVMFRKELVLAAGGYNPVFDGVEDYELWLRLERITQLENLEEELTLYRIWPQQVTQKTNSRAASLAQIIRLNSRYGQTHTHSWENYSPEKLRKYASVKIRSTLLSLVKDQKISNALALLSTEFFNTGLNQLARNKSIGILSLFGIIRVLVSAILYPPIILTYLKSWFPIMGRHRTLEKVTQFDIQGGTGNQLFQYFAGLRYSQNNKVELRVSHEDAELVESGIKLLDLPSLAIKIESKKSGLSKSLKRTFQYFLRRSAPFRIVAQQFFKIYLSPDVGYETDLISKQNLRKVIGYFQSYAYLPSFVSESGIGIVSQGELLTRMILEIQEKDPIIIHIRGGDYRNLVRSFGILSATYYRNALDHFDHAGHECELWVFSNDEELSESIIGQLPYQITKRIYQSSLNSAETLILMSYARRIVIANSTFSWWAAYLRGGNKTVVTPNKWFREMRDPNDFIPSHWVKVDSDWLD